MKKNLIFVFLLIFFFSNESFAQQIKKPAVSGTFYPDSSKILAKKIKSFLSWAEVTPEDKDILALISPHAGYDYSGSIAAYGYKLIKDRPITTVIIVGPATMNISTVSRYIRRVPGKHRWGMCLWIPN